MINGDEDFEQVIEYALVNAAVVITYTRNDEEFVEGPRRVVCRGGPRQGTEAVQ